MFQIYKVFLRSKPYCFKLYYFVDIVRVTQYCSIIQKFPNVPFQGPTWFLMCTTSSARRPSMPSTSGMPFAPSTSTPPSPPSRNWEVPRRRVSHIFGYLLTIRINWRSLLSWERCSIILYKSGFENHQWLCRCIRFWKSSRVMQMPLVCNIQIQKWSFSQKTIHTWFSIYLTGNLKIYLCVGRRVVWPEMPTVPKLEC